ncbi:alpha/beta fold hydrolase [Luteimonas sp. MC1572]|nr:alpha/beta fold hydrolase [Luteimonas sp. MC1572]QQO03725.1 alpha/beta fold hydrolase [Luteimonas sp. MC1572]
MSLVERTTPAFASTPSHHDAADAAPPAADTATRCVAVRGEVEVVLPMRHADPRRLRLAYELQGAVDAPVVLVAGGVSADRHLVSCATFPARGWADAVAGAGTALDPARMRLLAFDHVGADGRLDAPIDAADQADASALLLDALGIARLHAFVGYSYGAMVGLQFAVRHGGRLACLVAVSGAHRAYPAGQQRLSESTELHRLDPASVRVPTTVVAVDGDQLVPLSDAVDLVEAIGGPARLRVLRSPHGHDAFLKGGQRIDAILRSALGAPASGQGEVSPPCRLASSTAPGAVRR